MTEYFDVVDEKDKPTGQKITKDAAHLNNVPHRVAAVLVFRPNGNLLVQAHRLHNRLLDHSVGGHVSFGETYEQAAKREMKEELGIGIKIKKIAQGVISKEMHYKLHVQYTHFFGIFTAQVSEGWEHTETDEVDQLIEMSVENIVKEMNANPDKFLQGFMTTLGAYLNSINSPLKITAYGRNWGTL